MLITSKITSEIKWKLTFPKKKSITAGNNFRHHDRYFNESSKYFIDFMRKKNCQ